MNKGQLNNSEKLDGRCQRKFARCALRKKRRFNVEFHILRAYPSEWGRRY
jgi:hypothetical protein